MVNTNFRRFLALTLPHRWKLAGGAGLIILSTLLTLPSPWIFKLLIDQALPRHDLRLFTGLLVAFAVRFLLRGLDHALAGGLYARLHSLQFESIT